MMSSKKTVIVLCAACVMLGFGVGRFVSMRGDEVECLQHRFVHDREANRYIFYTYYTEAGSGTEVLDGVRYTISPFVFTKEFFTRGRSTGFESETVHSENAPIRGQ